MWTRFVVVLALWSPIYTGVIPKSLPVLSTEPVLLLSTEDYGFRRMSTEGQHDFDALGKEKTKFLKSHTLSIFKETAYYLSVHL